MDLKFYLFAFSKETERILTVKELPADDGVSKSCKQVYEIDVELLLFIMQSKKRQIVCMDSREKYALCRPTVTFIEWFASLPRN